jgi:hypothetical protein
MCVQGGKGLLNNAQQTGKVALGLAGLLNETCVWIQHPALHQNQWKLKNAGKNLKTTWLC